MGEIRNTGFVLKITVFLLTIGFVIFCANIVMFLIYTNIVRGNSQSASDKNLKLQHASIVSGSLFGHRYVTVNTDVGLIKGIQSVELGTKVFKFLGIPYAAKPIGELRYKPSLPVKPWKGTISATNFSKECVQDYDEICDKVSEDCLYLNIWTPSLSTNQSYLKPVMVWIHEGEFIDGSASRELLDGSALALLGDVVVVTFNYRLGVLGFLDLGVEESPGNQGLYDQALALMWVKENIRPFGGNPDMITLFGQSSGAIAIGLHLVSPASKFLFRRAIMQSGSPMVFQSYFANTKKVAARLTDILGCRIEKQSSLDTDGILKCMRSKSIDELIQAQKKLLGEREFAFSPSSKESLLPNIPVNVIIDPKRYKGFEYVKELLIGVTSDEGSIFVNFLMPEILSKDRLSSEEVRDLLISNSRKLLIPESKAKLLTNTFLTNAPKEESSRYWFKVLSNIVGDLFITCPSIVFAEEMVNFNKSVYFYVFNHKTSSLTEESPWMGVPHASEIPFLFGLPLRYPTKFSGKDIEISKLLINAWTTFATTGSMPSSFKPTWERFTTKNGDYYEIKTTKLRMKQKFHDNNCSIFRKRYDDFKNETKPKTVSVKVGWSFT